jgi:uncharacterized Zn finger protein
MIGTEWKVKGSKGDEYSVEMVDSGFTCSCPAFRKCKHIDLIESRIVGDV